MKDKRKYFLVAISTFFLPAACQAHSFSIFHFPMSYVLYVFLLDNPVVTSVIILTVLMTEFLFWKVFIRKMTWMGTLWRAGLLYFIPKAGEWAVVTLFSEMEGVARPRNEAVVTALLLLVLNVCLKVPIARILYRSNQAGWLRVLTAAIVVTIGGYAAALLAILAISLVS